MIIRKIRKEDLNERNVISSVCFEMPYIQKSNDELLEELKNPPRRIEEKWQDRWCAFSDDGETMYSSLGSFVYDAYFDDNVIKMSAISGVITMPQYRKHGAIRECLKKAFDEMHERDIPISYLYPFSSAYYNKFGYEPVMKKVVWRFPISSIKKFNVEGNVKFYQPLDDITDLKTIYNTYMKDCNYAISRNDIDWKALVKTFALDYKPQQFTYSFTSADGLPKAFITFSKEFDENKRRVMTCKNFFCLDFEGLSGILQFVRNFSFDYDDIQFTTDEFFRPEKVFTEFSLRYENINSAFMGMARIIDVEKILRIAKYQGSGKVTISISDLYCSWNNGTYEITFGNNKLVDLKKVDKSSNYDAKMNIDDFTALISGRYSIEDFSFIPELEVTGNIENLSKIFYRKKMFIWDLF